MAKGSQPAGRQTRILCYHADMTDPDPTRPIPPFTTNPTATIGNAGEARLLRDIQRWIADVSPAPPFGFGDDCAVLDSGDVGTLLVTVDPVIFGRHFDATCTPEAAGAKLLKRNLSDIAAMGGSPAAAVLALTLSRDVSLAYLERFFRGLVCACGDYGVTLVGGDVAEAPGPLFAAHLTQHGSASFPMSRAGGQPGDRIYVTGALGGSGSGHHLSFTPRLAEGQWLARQRIVRGCIDLSDGLAKDLPQLLPAGSHAAIDPAAVPVSPAARHAAKASGQTALSHALSDGEDYELAFVIAESIAPEAFEAAWKAAFATPLTRLGRIAPADDPATDGCLVNAKSGTDLRQTGYEHFSS